MDDYTILCTEEQTRKALELGAPIIKVDTRDKRMIYYGCLCYPRIADYPYAIPTAEQMLGWLRSMRFKFKIIEYENYVYFEYSIDNYVSHNTKTSVKEATLEVINKSLEYLIKNEKCLYY